MLLVIAVGVFYVKAANYSRSCRPPSRAEGASGWDAPLVQTLFGFTQGTFGWGGVIAGAAVVFFAFIGFDIVATAAEETRDPQRDLPRGILGSLAICTVLYVAVSLVVVGMQHYTELNADAPLAGAFSERRAAVLRRRSRSGRPGRPDVGGHDPAARPVAGAVRHEPRPAAARRRSPRCTPRTARPYRITIVTGVVVAVLAGVVPLERAGRAGQHRHAVRVRARVDRRASSCAAPGPTCRGRSGCR